MLDIPYQFRKMKWAWQRATRGFGDDDLWNLDEHLKQHLIKTLTVFLEEYTYQWTGTDNPERFKIKGELEEAVKMLKTPEWISDETKIVTKETTGEQMMIWEKEDQARIEKAFQMIGKYLGYLWD